MLSLFTMFIGIPILLIQLGVVIIRTLYFLFRKTKFSVGYALALFPIMLFAFPLGIPAIWIFKPIISAGAQYGAPWFFAQGVAYSVIDALYCKTYKFTSLFWKLLGMYCLAYCPILLLGRWDIISKEVMDAGKFPQAFAWIIIGMIIELANRVSDPISQKYSITFVEFRAWIKSW